MDRERLRRPKPPVTGTAPQLGRRPRRARGMGATARLGRCVGQRCRLHGIRTEVGLAQRIGIAGSASAGVRAQERAVCRNRRPTAAAGERRTSARPQNDLVRTNEKRPANRAFSLKPPAIGQPRVRNQSDRRQRNNATAPTKKTPQMQAFSEAAEGIRTLDLLRGKQRVGEGFSHKLPANALLHAGVRHAGVWDFTPIAGRLRTG
jgi:hypothetical protein